MSSQEMQQLLKSGDERCKQSTIISSLSILVALVALGFTLFFVLYPSEQTPSSTWYQVSKGGGDRPYGSIWSTRSPVLAQNGIAATSQPLATQTALDILKKGGNAVDAAIAANAVLGLVEPTGSGIGGDLMAIVWDPATKKLHGLNAGGRSSKSISYENMKERLESLNLEFLPPLGPLPVNVPGCVDGWYQLHSKFGTLNMSDLLQPAINYARNGFPVTQIISGSWRSNVAYFKNNQDQIPHFQNFLNTFTINGSGPSENQIFKNPDLANTLSIIASEGRNAFYNGTLTETMASFFESIGCCLTRQDFVDHFSTWEDTMNSTYRGYTIHELHPNTQGLATLQILNILEYFNLSSFGHNTADFIHASVEAKKLAFADRAKYYADPAFYNDSIIYALNSKDYAKERYKLINMQKAMQSVYAGNPYLEEGDTIYMTVADKNGMMVSLIQSNYRGLGSGLVPDGLGFCFQDRGQLFSMINGSRNVYAPGKRPFHTIIPSFITDKDGDPLMSFGVMGGDMQPQGQAQIVINIVDFGMDVQAAGDAARWYHFNGNEPTGEVMVNGGTLGLESGVDSNVVKDLQSRGHSIKSAVGQFGGYQAILWDKVNKIYIGASEMRKDGHAAGY